MDDRKGVPLRQDLMRAIRGEPMFAVAAPPPAADGAAPARRGLLLALEGGEGAGKSTQARLLSIWLRDQGYDVVATHEPGATKVGMRLRAMLLDTAHAGLDPRAEALMYAADRAEHVDLGHQARAEPRRDRRHRPLRGLLAGLPGRRPEPAARRGDQDQPVGDRRADPGPHHPARPAAVGPGSGRRARSADRLEAEPAEFHNRVRAGFRQLADAEPRRYLVLDATRPADELSREIQDRVRELLPDPVPPSAEAITGTFPAITEPGQAERRPADGRPDTAVHLRRIAVPAQSAVSAPATSGRAAERVRRADRPGAGGRRAAAGRGRRPRAGARWPGGRTAAARRQARRHGARLAADRAAGLGP